MKDIIKELIETHGISSYEDKIREKIKEMVSKYGETRTDNMGNLILTIGNKKGKHILLIAHMDELGMVVTYIEENGMICFRKIGGIDDRTLVGRVVEIHTKKRVVNGVIGLPPPHLTDEEKRKKIIPANDLRVDVGTTSKKETEKLGIGLLDSMRLKKNFTVLNKKMVCGRGMDDRVGCTVLIGLLKKIGKRKLKNQISFVWSVQEEVGLRGASIIGRTLKPDYAFPVDTYATADIPGLDIHIAPGKLGHGPVMRMIDNRVMATPSLRYFVEGVAKKHKIPLQLSVSGGTTDAFPIQIAEEGIPTLPICVPTKYVHSPVEVCHLDDMENLVKLFNHIIDEI